jgi:hypothetical protein
MSEKWPGLSGMSSADDGLARPHSANPGKEFE